MKLLRVALIDFFLLASVHLLAFAHETEMPHEEPVPTISPALLVGIAVVLVILGFLLWKYVLHKPSTPPVKTKTPQTQKKVVK